MQKTASSVVLGRSIPSTYSKKYASGPSLSEALLETRFEHHAGDNHKATT